MSKDPLLQAIDFRYTKSKYVTGIDKLMRLKKEKPFWEVVEAVIDFWKSLNPKEYKSYVLHLKDIKDTRKEINVGNKRFRGISKDKVTGGYLNYTLDIPETVYFIIKRLYDDTEAMADMKKFLYQFSKKFPEFRVSGKV